MVVLFNFNMEQHTKMNSAKGKYDCRNCIQLSILIFIVLQLFSLKETSTAPSDAQQSNANQSLIMKENQLSLLNITYAIQQIQSTHNNRVKEFEPNTLFNRYIMRCFYSEPH